jgi:putative transposase
MHEIDNAIFYILRGGVASRMPPPCFPPQQTVYRWFAALRRGHVWEAVTRRLVMLDRERAGREANPSAAVFDSQSVKTTGAGGPRGYVAGKKVPPGTTCSSGAGLHRRSRVQPGCGPQPCRADRGEDLP